MEEEEVEERARGFEVVDVRRLGCWSSRTVSSCPLALPS